jgi:hypothetical protein
MIRTSQSFSVAELVAVGADEAFAFLRDGMNQRFWALGSWDRRDLGDDVFVGTSLVDGTELYVRVISHPTLLLVDFETGATRESLAPRARVSSCSRCSAVKRSWTRAGSRRGTCSRPRSR